MARDGEPAPGSPPAPSGTPGVAASVVAAIAGELRALGFDAAAAVPEAFVVRGDGTIDSDHANLLLDRAARALDDDHVGVTVAARLGVGTMGDLDYALCTSPTLRAAWAMETRFYRLVSRRATLAFEEDDATAALTLTPHPGATLSRHWIEFPLAIHAQRVRQMLGERARFVRVELAGPMPPRPEVLTAWFDAEVRADAGRNALVFPSTLLDLPTRTGLPHLVATLTARLVALAPELDPLVEQVRGVVVAMIGASPQLEEIADRLGRSGRTLQRELADCGTSFRQVVDDVRRDHAVALLQRGATAEQVAAELGFSEPGAFYRAFRRWTGQAPGSFRPTAAGDR
ncbi:MAG: AraC family transcriptional regulator ligand-binding domain-containing protein [Myxococcales bacterium]|nr:AraC family transcriptional regulator ligand-binding domain-containing protein [Myxococcales bacterium]